MSMTQNCDVDFFSLLCAQREILKRLNREKSSMAIERHGLKSTGQTGESATNFTSTLIKLGSLTEISDPLYLMNEPIIERRFSQDDLLHTAKSRRISGGFDILSAYGTPSSNDFADDKKKKKRPKITPKKRFQVGASTLGRKSAERHNGLCGIIANALVFDVDSTTARTPSNSDLRYTKNSVFTNAPKEGCKRVQQLDPNIDLATLRGEFENFVIAMEKSIKSQQDIHDWDRMMGLKRSHSKTMRLSMRSRNKLRKVTNV